MPTITPIGIAAGEPRTTVKVRIEVDQATRASAVADPPKPWRVRIEGTYVSDEGLKPLPTAEIPVSAFALEPDQPADGQRAALSRELEPLASPVAGVGAGDFNATATLLNPADHEQDGPKQFP